MASWPCKQVCHGSLNVICNTGRKQNEKSCRNGWREWFSLQICLSSLDSLVVSLLWEFSTEFFAPLCLFFSVPSWLFAKTMSAAADNALQISVQFITKLPNPVPSSALSVPVSLTRFGLSEIVVTLTFAALLFLQFIFSLISRQYPVFHSVTKCFKANLGVVCESINDASVQPAAARKWRRREVQDRSSERFIKVSVIKSKRKVPMVQRD